MKTTEGAKGHEGAFSGAMPPRGTGAFPYIGNAPSDAPNSPSEGHGKNDFTPPIEVIPGQTRILLSEAASRHLEAVGSDCFMIVSKAKTPDVIGRWVIHLVPCSMKTARNAEAVLMGRAKATYPKPPKPTPSK